MDKKVNPVQTTDTRNLVKKTAYNIKSNECTKINMYILVMLLDSICFQTSQ